MAVGKHTLGQFSVLLYEFYDLLPVVLGNVLRITAPVFPFLFYFLRRLFLLLFRFSLFTTLSMRIIVG